jgi:hypothetical protein
VQSTNSKALQSAVDALKSHEDALRGCQAVVKPLDNGHTRIQVTKRPPDKKDEPLVILVQQVLEGFEG